MNFFISSGFIIILCFLEEISIAKVMSPDSNPFFNNSSLYRHLCLQNVELKDTFPSKLFIVKVIFEFLFKL